MDSTTGSNTRYSLTADGKMKDNICDIAQDTSKHNSPLISESVPVDNVCLEQDEKNSQQRLTMSQTSRQNETAVQSDIIQLPVASITQPHPRPLEVLHEPMSSSKSKQDQSVSVSPDNFQDTQSPLPQHSVAGTGSSQQVHRGQEQISFKVLPQNITIKPTVLSVPARNESTRLPIGKIPIIQSLPQNTAIIIKRDGGGPISNPTSAFVDEMVKRSGMKIVESQTRILLTADDTRQGSNQLSGPQNQRCAVETNGQRPACFKQTWGGVTARVTPTQITSGLQYMSSQRPQLLAFPQRQSTPGYPYQTPRVSNHQQYTNQTRTVSYTTNGQINVGLQSTVARSGSSTVTHPGQSQVPTNNAPGVNYIKVRLQEKRYGSQWILLPKDYAHPKIYSPPLPRKQPESRDVHKCLKNFERYLKECSGRTTNTNASTNILDDRTASANEGVAEEAMDIDEEPDDTCPVHQDQVKSEGDINVQPLVKSPGIYLENGESEGELQDITDENKRMQNPLQNKTCEKSKHLVEPSRGEQDISPRTTVSSASLTEGSEITNTSKAVSSGSCKLATSDATTLECPSKISTSNEYSSTQKMRIATATTCTSTLTYASLSPRCKTTYTRVADAEKLSGDVADTRNTSGLAVGDSSDSCGSKCDASQASSLDGYSGPVDMYVYLPEKAFKNGSVTFLSLRK